MTTVSNPNKNPASAEVTDQNTILRLIPFESPRPIAANVPSIFQRECRPRQGPMSATRGMRVLQACREETFQKPGRVRRKSRQPFGQRELANASGYLRAERSSNRVGRLAFV